MKLTILILALFFLSCEKEESKRTPKQEVCLEIKSSSPGSVSGYIGETPITKATCAYIVSGDSVLIKIHSETPAYFTIKLYKNNELVAYKANNCAYTFYQLRHKF